MPSVTESSRKNRPCSRALALVAFLTLAAACAGQTVETEWERIDSPRFLSPDGAWELELPVGWVRSGGVLSRVPDGDHLISFNAGPVLEGEQALAVDPSAPELVQALHDQLASQPGIEVLECTAGRIDGLPAFRAHFVQAPSPEAAEEGAVKREHLLYSAIDGEMLYAFALEAPAGAGFARDLPEFERLVASFRRLPARPPP